MTILAYTYEAAVHCTACTRKTFGVRFIKMSELSDYFLPDDREGNRIRALFSTDEWQNLVCNDCLGVIGAATHQG